MIKFLCLTLALSLLCHVIAGRDKLFSSSMLKYKFVIVFYMTISIFSTLYLSIFQEEILFSHNTVFIYQLFLFQLNLLRVYSQNHIKYSLLIFVSSCKWLYFDQLQH